jgi:hypothetical protein
VERWAELAREAADTVVAEARAKAAVAGLDGGGGGGGEAAAASAPPASVVSGDVVAAAELAAARMRAAAAALPWRALTLAERCAPACRALEKSRAWADWEAQVLATELALAGLGGRLLPLGVDRAGRAFFALGGAPGEVWVQGPGAPLGELALAPPAPGAAALAQPARPHEWGVADAPAQLLALLARLAPLGCREGGLRESLLRRAPAMLAAMHSAPPRRATTAPSAAPAAPHADCAVCAAPLPPMGAPAVPPPHGAPPLHCFVCHAALPPCPLPSLAAAGLARHVAACWAAHARPLTRAAALAAAGVAAARTPAAAAHAVSAAADAQGVPRAALSLALSPGLLRLKRQAVALGEAVEWERLRQPSVWPPPSRALWAGALAAALTPLDVLRALAALEAALAADDAAAVLEARLDGGARERAELAASAVVHAGGGRGAGGGAAGASLSLAAAVTAALQAAPRVGAPAAAAAGEPADPAGGGDAPGDDAPYPAPPPPWRWLPSSYRAAAPSALAAEGVATLPAAAARLRALAAALQPCLRRGGGGGA